MAEVESRSTNIHCNLIFICCNTNHQLYINMARRPLRSKLATNKHTVPFKCATWWESLAYDKSYTAFVHNQQIPNPSCYCLFQSKCHFYSWVCSSRAVGFIAMLLEYWTSSHLCTQQQSLPKESVLIICQAIWCLRSYDWVLICYSMVAVSAKQLMQPLLTLQLILLHLIIL